MPAYNDADNEEQQGSANAPRYTAPSKQQEPQYTPWSSFQAANQSVSDREAGKLQNQTQNDVNRAQSDLTSATDAEYGTHTILPSGSAMQRQPKQAAGSTPATVPPTSPKQPAQASSSTPPQAWESLIGGAQPPLGSLPGSYVHADQTINTATPGLVGPQLQQAPSAGLVGPQAQQKPTAQLAGPQPQGPTAGAAPLKPGSMVKPPAQNPPLASDLESAVGAQSWDQLLNDTTRATGEANALGSEQGVQGLLQSQMSAPGNSAFDAALINGAGGKGFRDLAQKYGNGQLIKNVADANQKANDAWTSLQAKKNAPKPEAQTIGPSGFVQGSLMSSPGAAQSSDPNNDAGMAIATQAGNTQAAHNNNQVIWNFQGSKDENAERVSYDGSTGHFMIDIPSDGKSRLWNNWWGGAQGAPANGSNFDPNSLGLSAAQWYALANMTPAQRAKWWKDHEG